MTVDAEIFDSIADAIKFVAANGGGTIHTSLFGTQYAQSLNIPPNVRLAPPRPTTPPL